MSASGAKRQPVTPWSGENARQNENFEPKSMLGAATTAGLQGAGAGLFFATLQNALGTHGSGAFGVLTRYGSTVGMFAAMGATFAATEAVVANQRETEDSLNGAAGACAAGFLLGVRARSLPAAVGSCAVLAGAIGAFDYAGASLMGTREHLTTEEKRARFFKQKPVGTPAPEE